MWRHIVDVLFRRTAAVKLAEFEEAYEKNMASTSRVGVASRELQVASERSTEHLKRIRSDITKGVEEEKASKNDPRSADVLRLARSVLERVQKH